MQYTLLIVLDSQSLSFFYDILMGSLCISLTSPATLEHLEFNIRFGCDSTYNFHRFMENLRDADLWSSLDFITTHQAGSRLQRVDVNIEYTGSYDDYMQCEPTQYQGQVVKAILDNLPLLHTRGILFIKAISES